MIRDAEGKLFEFVLREKKNFFMKRAWKLYKSNLDTENSIKNDVVKERGKVFGSWATFSLFLSTLFFPPFVVKQLRRKKKLFTRFFHTFNWWIFFFKNLFLKVKGKIKEFQGKLSHANKGPCFGFCLLTHNSEIPNIFSFASNNNNKKEKEAWRLI